MDNDAYVAPEDIRGRIGEIQFFEDFMRNKDSARDQIGTGLPFVTISRESCSGGHLLSHVLMTDFLKQDDHDALFKDWHIFDRQLCETIAQNSQMQNSVEQLLHEKYHSEFKDFVDSLFTGQSDKYTLHKTTSRIIHMLATIGKVIIVNSSACCITRDLKSGVHVRLVAPELKRTTWMMKRFNMNKAEALEAVDEQDHCQKKLIKQYFNKDVEDPLLYDTIWNTARVEMHEISHAIIDMIRDRARRSK